MYPIIRRSNVPTTRSLLDSIFEDDWGFAPIFNSFLREATPQIKTNVTASDSDYRIDLVMPGLDKNDINIDVNDTTISISHEAKEGNSNIVSYSSFHRSWTLPKNVDPTNVNAEYNQGILSVIVPKPETEIPVSHRIEVK
jgi:HSP20 family protein|tara:strand:- start:201 stop:620 length:420 start_codon:yes stop_codon:yes gene_type:complete